MSKMMIGFVAALSLLSVAGCKKKGGGAAAEALSKMEGFSKSMCDCKDKACADKVNDEMTKWGQEMAKNAKPGDAEKPDPDMAKKSADVMTKYTECMTKLMMAGMGGGSGSAAAEPVKKDEPAAGSGSDAKKDEPAAGSDKKDAAAAGSDAKKDEPKKDEPKKDDKKPDDKKAGGW